MPCVFLSANLHTCLLIYKLIQHILVVLHVCFLCNISLLQSRLIVYKIYAVSAVFQPYNSDLSVAPSNMNCQVSKKLLDLRPSFLSLTYRCEVYGEVAGGDFKHFFYKGT